MDFYVALFARVVRDNKYKLFSTGQPPWPVTPESDKARCDALCNKYKRVYDSRTPVLNMLYLRFKETPMFRKKNNFGAGATAASVKIMDEFIDIDHNLALQARALAAEFERRLHSGTGSGSGSGMQLRQRPPTAAATPGNPPRGASGGRGRGRTPTPPQLPPPPPQPPSQPPPPGGDDDDANGCLNIQPPAPALSSDRFYMLPKLHTMPDDDPPLLDKAEADAWVDRFCEKDVGAPGWIFADRWKAANDGLPVAKLETLKGRFRVGAGNPFDVGASQGPGNNYTDPNEQMYAGQDEFTPSIKVRDLQSGVIPEHGGYRPAFKEFVRHFYGRTYAYLYVKNRNGGFECRGAWYRGTIVGLYMDMKKRTFGGVVMFRSLEHRVVNNVTVDTYISPTMKVITDLSSFYKDPAIKKWNVTTPIDETTGYMYMDDLNCRAVIDKWSWQDNVLLRMKNAKSQMHRIKGDGNVSALLQRHDTTVIAADGTITPHPGVYVRLWSTRPFTYAIVDEINEGAHTIVINVGIKFLDILGDDNDMMPDWYNDENGKILLKSSNFTKYWPVVVANLPDGMMYHSTTADELTLLERHDRMFIYNNITLHSKLEDDDFIKERAPKLHDGDTSVAMAYAHAGLAASEVRATSWDNWMYKLSFKLATKRLREAMWAACDTGMHAYTRRNYAARKRLDNTVQHADDSAESSDDDADAVINQNPENTDSDDEQVIPYVFIFN